MNSVDLSFRYSEKDYVQGMQAHYASRLRVPLDVVMIVVLGGTGAYLWYSNGTRYGMLLVGLAALLAVMLVAAFLVVPRLVFRREPKFRDEYSLSFSPEGIHFRTEHIDSKLEWSMYSRALIGARSYLLYYGERTVTVIPKRAFATVEDRNRFEHLLAEKVPNLVTKGA